MTEVRAAVRRILDDLKLQAGGEHPCPYLGNGSETGLLAREIGFFVEKLPPGFYHALLDLGFRRSGQLLYKPQCAACAECRQIRVPVAAFRTTRAQRRCLNRNLDLTWTLERPEPTDEKYALYRRYLATRHSDGTMGNSYANYTQFLYESCVDTREAVFRLDGKIVAVSLLDVEPQALSAVYCYYDPALPKRSLGLFNMLWSVQHCRGHNIRWYYMGYYIAGCRKMNYKTGIQPSEILQPDGRWEPVNRVL